MNKTRNTTMVGCKYLAVVFFVGTVLPIVSASQSRLALVQLIVARASCA
jgi:hypothetical protein